MNAVETRPWVWPVNWNRVDADVSVLANSPLLAAHRELDRLSALCRDVNEGVPDASGRLKAALRRIRRLAPWLGEAASAIEARTSRDCQCREEFPAPLSPATGFLDDGGISVLLAYSAGVEGQSGADLVLGLAAAAMAAEATIPGVTRTLHTGALTDLSFLAGRGQTTPVPQPPKLMGGATPGIPGLPGGGLPGGKKIELEGIVSGKKDWGDIVDPLKGIDIEVIDFKPVTPPFLEPVEVIDEKEVRRLGCLWALKQLLTPEPQPARVPTGAPVTWTTGIASVAVANPCSSSPIVTISGGPFGGAQPANIGVVAPLWDETRKQVICRPATVLSWSDTEIKVLLPSTVVSGAIGFADAAYIALYDAWVDRENARVQAALKAAACAGVQPPGDLVLRKHWSECPLASPAVRFQAGKAYMVVQLMPANGGVQLWAKNLLRLSPAEKFWLHWWTANATTVHRAEQPAIGVLSAAGEAASGTAPASGSILLTAPSIPRRWRVQFTATGICNSVVQSLEAVVIAPPLQQAVLAAASPIPGGDIQVVQSGGKETLEPGGRSIPLVAGKRTVVRLDWQFAVPGAPKGDEVTARATVWAKVAHPSGPISVELRAQANTSQPPPDPSGPPLEQKPTGIFTNDRQMFNFVLPASLAVGEVTLTAYITARSPGTRKGAGDLYYYATATVQLRFHKRRTVKFRYERWGTATTAPTDSQCSNALRTDGALLPIPDPEIISLFPSPRLSDTLVEDLFALKSNTPGASGQEEIWFTIGAPASGGVALASTPWVVASDPGRCVSAHEVSHTLGQNHINHPSCGPNDGDDRSTFPDSAQVVVVGFDQWANGEVVDGIDYMTYCWGNAWISPERWRRLFLKVGP